MRKLNKKQKNLINKWFNTNWNGAGSIYTIDQMPVNMINNIENLNPHETFFQNADRYISDKALQKTYDKIGF